MSMATRVEAGAAAEYTQSPALHVADSHDLIRVHGARVNNLADVSVEIPKRRLTVFTGVSGSGRSSLVFDTIDALCKALRTGDVLVATRLDQVGRSGVSASTVVAPACC